MRDGIVIVGGGLAAQRCAEALRREGYDGALKMVCSEPRLPYDRPPLSKRVLAGEQPDDSVSYRSPDWYRSRAIELLLGVSAIELMPSERRLSLSDGTSLRFDKLLIATGSRPRALPLLAGFKNVSMLRGLDDCVALREALLRQSSLAVIGAGFIGLEVAATARKLGVEVTMIEAAESPLVGVLGPQLGAWFSQLHREEGVELITNATVQGLRANGAVSGLRLRDGRVVSAEHVVVGIGVQPDVQWLGGTGLSTSDGIRTDADGRTALQTVFAAGDAAASFDPILGRHVAGSHWEAAARQGARAARAMLGLEPGPATLTSFWTDQYGIRIQYLGRASLADSVVFDGEPQSRSFVATFTRKGRPVAALLVGRPRQLSAARQSIENGGLS